MFNSGYVDDFPSILLHLVLMLLSTQRTTLTRNVMDWISATMLGILLGLSSKAADPHPEVRMTDATKMTGVVLCLETGNTPAAEESDLLQQVCHLNGGEGGVEALVSPFRAGAFDGLLQGVGGQNAENDRPGGLEGYLGDAL